MRSKKSPATLIYYNDKISKKRRAQSDFTKARRARKLKVNYKLLILLTFVILSIIGLVYFAEDRKWFHVKEIQVVGLGSFVNTKDVQRLSEGVLLNRSFFSFKSSDLEQALGSNFLGAKEFNVNKKLFGIVKVDILERTPYVVAKDVFGNLYYVDQEGFVLGNAAENSSNLPEVLYDKEVLIGKFIDFVVLARYLELITSLEKEDLSAKEIEIFPRHISFTLLNKTKVFYTLSQSFLSQSRILGDLLKDIQTENKIPIRIDLRFDKVIVEFNQSSESSATSNTN